MLELIDLTVEYGGLRAVDRVTLSARSREITGLIGPNGAGKSSIFGACSGTVPAGGYVRFDGQDMSSWGPARRARTGIARTFQRPQLFESLPVLDNVMIGAEGHSIGSRPWRYLGTSFRHARQQRDTARDALERCGLGSVGLVPAGALSLGQRRLVELARAIVARPSFLLLDEPASGLSSAESEAFAGHLQTLRDEGVGVLLVEHDLELVESVCDSVHVIEFGRLIFSGSMQEAWADVSVRRAYLGTSEAT